MNKEHDLDQVLNKFTEHHVLRVPEYVANVLKEMELFENENPRMRNVTRELGELLSFLVINKNSKNILELGTSNGYSTIWLALAAKKTGGKVTTIENQEWKVDLAMQNIKKAGLSDITTVLTGDALEVSKKIDKIDCLFMDIWPGDYLPCIQNILPMMTSGSLIVVDNLLTHRNRKGNITPRGPEGDDYLQFISRKFKTTSSVMPIGSGVQVGVLI
jgi:predicted O-methyltransferase YrrM